ncbi:ABC transporter substrate-binding protein [Paenibacillaceae bacterium WGS1546]|uniref:ABC transporter substrate-binding protein n=1 Tax=Cohnella sp. WGS1546 TaxID=3366810 RepID=UPI00372D0028
MKRSIAWGLAILFVLSTVLTACQSGGSKDGSSGETAGQSSNDGKVVKLKIWGGVPEEYGPQQAVDMWNAQNPDIQVEYVRYVNDDAGNTKLETALLAGGQVDLFINHRMDKVAKRIEAGMAEPLDSLIAEDGFDVVDNFGDNAVVMFGEQTYYLPATIIYDFVTINKSFLDEAGLPVPARWTWDDYVEYARSLSAGEGSNKRWGSYVHNLQPVIYEYLDKAVKTELGTNAIYKPDGTSNFDHPAFKKYFDTMYDLEQNLKVQPPLAEAKATKMEGAQMFVKSDVAMLWAGTASLRTIMNVTDFPHDFVTAFAPPPLISEDSKYESGGTLYLDFTMINKRSPHKDEAWKFLKWYVTEGFEAMIPFGRVPAWKKFDKDEVVRLMLGDQPERYYDVDSFKRVMFADLEPINDTKFTNIAEIQKIVEDEGERILIGERSIQEGIESMKKRSDTILEGK